MKIPNVLAAALKIIPPQPITYKKFLRNDRNAMGNDVPVYDTEITTDGSLQPAGASLLWKLGLANVPDLWVCYVRANVISEVNATSNDVIIDSNGREYNLFKTNNWFEYPDQDWNKLLIQKKKSYTHA